MFSIAPQDYERYAVLVSPLLIPSEAFPRPSQPGLSVSPISESSGTVLKHNPDLSYDKSTQHTTDDQVKKSRFDLKMRSPIRHPDPITGRGQNVDILA